MRENGRRGGKFYENLFLIWWPIVVYILFGYLGRVGDRLPSFHEAAPMFYRIRGFFLVCLRGCRNARFFYSFRGNRIARESVEKFLELTGEEKEEKSRRGLLNSPACD